MLSKKFSNCQLITKPKNHFAKYTNKPKKMESKYILDDYD